VGDKNGKIMDELTAKEYGVKDFLNLSIRDFSG